MIPILKSILVDQLAWFGADEFGFGISIGQVTPGPILISAAFFGYKMWGIKGALISTIGIFLPSSMLMIFTSQVYQNIRNNILLKAAMTGVMPAVVGLIIYSGITLFLNHVEQNPLVIALAIFIVSFALAIKFQKGYPVLLFAGLLMAYLFSKF